MPRWRISRQGTRGLRSVFRRPVCSSRRRSHFISRLIVIERARHDGRLLSRRRISVCCTGRRRRSTGGVNITTRPRAISGIRLVPLPGGAVVGAQVRHDSACVFICLCGPTPDGTTGTQRKERERKSNGTTARTTKLNSNNGRSALPFQLAALLATASGGLRCSKAVHEAGRDQGFGALFGCSEASNHLSSKSVSSLLDIRRSGACRHRPQETQNCRWTLWSRL